MKFTLLFLTALTARLIVAAPTRPKEVNSDLTGYANGPDSYWVRREAVRSFSTPVVVAF
jgi:hypothetical protein